MNADPTPPRWAEATLRLVLRPDDFGSVSGDLLEEYRDSIHPLRGPRRADWWYVTQVLGFLFRRAWVWAALFGGALVARSALDWFVPPADFLARSRVSTAIAAGLMLTGGFWFAWRSGLLVAGTLAGAIIGLLGGAISLAGSAALLAIWHDPGTMAAIRHSGGFAEVEPFLVVPGLLLGTIGGLVGSGLCRTVPTPRFRSRRPHRSPGRGRP